MIVSRDRDGAYPYTMSILDSHGIEIESLESAVYAIEGEERAEVMWIISPPSY